MIKTTVLHVRHVFNTFLWRPLHDYDVKPPNAMFYGGRGHHYDKSSLFYLNMDKALKNQSTPGKIAHI